MGSGSTIGPIAADLGVFAATSHVSGFSAAPQTNWSSPAGSNGSPNSLWKTRWQSGDYVQFSTSTVGYESISIQWDQMRDTAGQAPTTFQLSWSLDGTNWTTLMASYGVGTTWATFGSVAAPTSADDQSTIYFRITSLSGQNHNNSQAGVDNIIISGTALAIPSPGTLALLGLAGLCGVRRRRSE